MAFAAAPRAQVVSLPITFEDAINYELTDFGGNASSIVADPTDATNTVVQSVRTAAAQCFAGTTVADATGFTAPIPFAPGATTMSVRVWSPAAGIPVLFKVEEVGVPTINVETLGVTTVAGAWETIVFDFGNPGPNTNPIQFGATYNKASIFFDFSCNLPPGPAPPERTYYWDDVTFGMIVAGEDAPSGFSATPTVFPNPTREDATVAFELASASEVTVEVFDALGRRLAVAYDGPHAAGVARIAIPTRALPAGPAFVRVRTDAGVSTTRISVVR
jgi:hypothetical protein